MQGLVLYPDGQFRLQEVLEPKIVQNPFAPHDVLIEVAYCGICGSDIHKWKEKEIDRKGVKGPSKAIVSGHEMSGTVMEFGSAVTDFKPGDWLGGEIVTLLLRKMH